MYRVKRAPCSTHHGVTPWPGPSVDLSNSAVSVPPLSLSSLPPSRFTILSRSRSRISNTLVQRPSASFSPFSSTVLTHPRGINCGRHDYRNGDPGPGGCLFHGRLTKAYPVMPTRQDEIKDRGSDASSTTSIRTRRNLPPTPPSTLSFASPLVSPLIELDRAERSAAFDAEPERGRE